MSDTIVAAIIGAVATIGAAVIAWVAMRGSSNQGQQKPPKKCPAQRQANVRKSLASDVVEAVITGRLIEPFSMADVVRLFPDAYESLLPNNAEDGNYGTNYFVRVEPGRYRIADRFRRRGTRN